MLIDAKLKGQSGIYVIINKCNWHYYIGSSQNLYKRAREHYNDLSKNKHHSVLLQRAVNKYGLDNFQFRAIDLIINKLEIKSVEQWYLDNIFGEYNVSRSAMCPGLGRVVSEETRRKISLTSKGRKLSDEHRQILRKAHLGKTISIETRQKLSQAHKNKTLSDDCKKKMSIARKGRPLKQSAKILISERKKKALYEIISDSEINYYSSMGEANKRSQQSLYSIRKSLKNNEFINGRKWSYVSLNG